jgi:hypothetical protein
MCQGDVKNHEAALSLFDIAVGAPEGQFGNKTHPPALPARMAWYKRRAG